MLFSERNFKIQLILFSVVIALAVYFDISKSEWVAIVISSATVLGLEMLNSSIEKLCNLITSEENETVKWIKDVSAGAVLIVSTGALVVGCLIFIPKIWSLFF